MEQCDRKTSNVRYFKRYRVTKLYWQWEKYCVIQLISQLVFQVYIKQVLKDMGTHSFDFKWTVLKVHVFFIMIISSQEWNFLILPSKNMSHVTSKSVKWIESYILIHYAAGSTEPLMITSQAAVCIMLYGSTSFKNPTNSQNFLMFG